MFTGLITDIGTITAIDRSGELRATVSCSYPAESLKLGESIACNGCCLTVVDFSSLRVPAFAGINSANDSALSLYPSVIASALPRNDAHVFFTVQITKETLACTATSWEVGARLNLERSLALGERMGGHLVTGHVDGVAKLRKIVPLGESYELELEAPPELAKYIAAKGSVTLDGVALTVNRVEENRFTLCIIPHSWAHTTLSQRRLGDGLNMEVDLIARYVARMLEKDEG